MSATADFTTWGEVRTLAEAQLPEAIATALRRFESERVVHLSLPYGEQVIENGTFRWDLLGDQKDWERQYGVPIPLALVATKTVELYDLVAHLSRHTTWKGVPRDPRRVIREPRGIGVAPEQQAIGVAQVIEIGQRSLSKPEPICALP